MIVENEVIESESTSQSNPIAESDDEIGAFLAESAASGAESKKVDANPKKEAKKSEDRNTANNVDADQILNDFLSEKKDGKEEKNEESTEEETTKDAEEVDGESKEESTEEFDVIKIDGQEIKLKKPELVEYAQKGFDYTKKTQALAEEKKAFQAEYSEAKKEMESLLSQTEAKDRELDEKVKRADQLDMLLSRIENKHPEIFQQLSSEWASIQEQVNNPFVDAKLSGALREINDLKSKLGARESEQIRTNYYNEKQDVEKTLAPVFEKFKFQPNWDKVQKVWAAGEQAGLTVRQAFNAVHADDLRKLHDSRSQAEQSKRNLAAVKKTQTIGGKSAGNKSTKTNIHKLNDNQMIDKFLAGEID